VTAATSITITPIPVADQDRARRHRRGQARARYGELPLWGSNTLSTKSWNSAGYWS
jgi:hypothetical protein